MPALVIGASGLVGGALMRCLGPDAVGTYRQHPRPHLRHLDAQDVDAVSAIVEETAPEVIFFPAGNPDVEWCERNPEAAETANLEPLRSTIAGAAGTSIIAYSSDYVFDGVSGPYSEVDRTNPISVYGRLKVKLEDETLTAGGAVIRTTGVFGWEPESAKNFVARLVASLSRGQRARVPSDQIANPIHADDLAQASIELARGGAKGVWHLAGTDLLARDAFARLVAQEFGLDASLIDAVPTAELGQAAKRPLRGGLRWTKYEERFGRPPARPLRTALASLRTQMGLTG